MDYENYLKIYLEKICFNLKEKTKKYYKKIHYDFINYLDDKEISDLENIDKEIILDYLTTFTTNSGANRFLRVFNLFITKLNDYEYIELSSPIKKFMFKKEQKKVHYFLNDNEIQRIINLFNRDLKKFKNENKEAFVVLRNKLIFLVLLTSGLRVSECLELTIKDINLKRQTIFIKESKTYKERLVPLNSNIIPVFNEYLEELKNKNIKSEFLFIDYKTKERVKYNTFNKYLYRMGKRLKIKEKRKLIPHNLRHKFATDRIKKNNNVFKLMKILGHSSIKTTEIYVNLTDVEICEEMKNSSKKQVNKYKI